MNLTTEQQGELIFRSRHLQRRLQKRYLKELGGDGTAEELDQQLAAAQASDAAVAVADRLDRRRHLVASAVELGREARVAELLADIRVRMEEQGVTQVELALRCGWQQGLVSDYFRGKSLPGAANLCKMAEALGCVWRLTPMPEK